MINMINLYLDSPQSVLISSEKVKTEELQALAREAMSQFSFYTISLYVWLNMSI